MAVVKRMVVVNLAAFGVLFAVLVATPAMVLAQTKPTEEPGSGAAAGRDDKPWAKGVTPKQRALAEKLLAQGNQLFLDSKLPEALRVYRRALGYYDHPSIRFNITRVLINLDRPTEAHENIVAALRFGRGPLADLYEEARNYERLLQSQIAELKVQCTQSGVSVTVDGKQFLACPGNRTVKLLPGNHQIVARRRGYMTLTREVVVLPGAEQPIDVKLISIADATVTKRRWKRWQPWAVVGGGVGLAGLGLLVELQAQSTRDQYADLLAAQCADEPCADAELSASTWRRARIEHAIGISAMVSGAAVLVTGLTLVIMNRPRDVLPEQPPQSPRTKVVPMVSLQGVGASLIHRF